MRILFIIFFLFQLSIGNCQSELARQYISVLTADSLAGRGFTEEGQVKAADFIVDKLKSYQVLPGIEETFRQELTYPVNTFPGSVQFSVEKQQAVKIFAAGKDFLFHSASAPLELKGELQPIPSSFDLTTKYKNQIFYLEKTEENAKEVEEFINSFLFKSSFKSNLLIVQDSSKWSWFPSSMVSENAVVFVKRKLKEHAEVSVINESIFEPKFKSSNIVGKIEGKRHDSVIMLTAHYDHLGQMGSAVFKGANDNASGVAMLIALADYYGKNQPDFDTYFLFTTAEEVGLLGSHYFIENPSFDLRKIKMLVNLDMVGTGDEGITVVNSEKNSGYFQLLKKINAGRIVQIKARGEACNSDHCLFDRIGIPAVFIYTLGGKQAYHDVNDNGEGLSLKAFDELHDIILESLHQY